MLGEEQKMIFECTFSRSLTVESRPERLIGDAGVVLLRELEERLGLTSSLGDSLDDHREQEQIRYSLTELLRQWIYGFVQSYRYQDDVDRPDSCTGQLSLWPERFFLVNNWPREQRGVDAILQHYRERGTFEDWRPHHQTFPALDSRSPKAVTPLWNLFQRALHRLRVHNSGQKSKRCRGWNPPPAHAHLCMVLRQ